MSDKFGGQHVEATGLNGDAMNIWQGPYNVAWLKGKQHPDYLDTPVLAQTYQEYIRENYGNMADIVIADAIPEPLAAFNDLVAQFNALSLEERMTNEIIFAFQQKAYAIITGETGVTE